MNEAPEVLLRYRVSLQLPFMRSDLMAREDAVRNQNTMVQVESQKVTFSECKQEPLF